MSWVMVKIGDVCRLMTGGTPKTTISEYYENGTVPWIVSGDIHKGEIFDCDKKITELAVENSNARYLPKDSVLIALNGQGKTRGTVALLRASNATCNQSIVSINPNDQRELLSDYLFYFLKSQYRQIRNITGDKDRAGLNMPLIRSIEIPLPPIEEQKRIAAILEKADSVRLKRQQAIDLADDFLRSVFLDMFGVDLQQNTDVTTFGDISILDAKMVDPREDEYLDLLHIGPDRIEKNTGKLLPSITAREELLISKKFLFNDQYILYSKIRPYLRKVALPDFRALCSADVYPIKPVQGKVTREFIWMLLLSDFFDNYISSLPARANIPKLNRTELAAFEFSLPDFSKIEKFTEIVKRSFEGSKAVADSHVKAENLFNSLSQKAFAGEL